MAKLIRKVDIEGKKSFTYECSGCGVEVTLLRPIGDRNTFCGKCMHSRKMTSIERCYRKKERDEILAMIEEIRQFHFFCMADLCDDPDRDCGRCSLDWVIERIKSRNGNN